MGTSKQIVTGNKVEKADAGEYEVVYIKKKQVVKPPIAIKRELDEQQVKMLAEGGAAAKSSMSYENNRDAYQATKTVAFKKEGYMVVSKTDLKSTNIYGTQTEAYEMQKTTGNFDTIILSTFE